MNSNLNAISSSAPSSSSSFSSSSQSPQSYSQRWNTLKDEAKASRSCIDYLNSHCGTHIHRQGQAIIAPRFIRPSSDSPSFGVYDDHCFDFVTNTPYDVIDLCALNQFNGDINQAIEYLSGKKLAEHVTSYRSKNYQPQADKFNERILYWHSELLKNPSVAPNGKSIPILDYLLQRGFSKGDICDLKLGFSPKTFRLMIPFFNRSGKPVYAAGRTMGASDPRTRTPKYSYLDLKDPDFSEILDKCIFGIDSVNPTKCIHDTAFDEESGQVIKLDSHPIIYDYLVVCEGMLDVLSFRTKGWAAISGKISKKQEGEFLAICKQYCDKGKKIFICFDSDKAGQNYQRNIALLLFRHGLSFVAGHLPDTITVTRDCRPDFGQEINIKDVNDYFAAGGSLENLVLNAKSGMYEIASLCKNEDELYERFMEGARSYDKYTLRNLKVDACRILDDDGQESVTDDDGVIHTTQRKHQRFDPKTVGFIYSEAIRPMQDCDIAHIVEKKHNMIYDTLGQFYEYASGVWSAMNDALIEQHIMRAMNGRITSGKIGSVCKYLKTDLAENVQFNTKNNFVFQNGTLWLDEDSSTNLEVGTDFYAFPKNFRHSRPEDMSTLQASFPYVPAARNEAIERAARQWTANRDGTPNEEKYRLLQQIFGYMLFVRNTLQKFFVLIGDGANGKSTCMHCIEAIFGKENCTSLQISRLASEFDPIALKHSRVNLCYDAQSAIENAQETLKALIGGDSIMAAHKGVDAERFTTNAKFIVSANRFFSANDISRGLLRRVLFLAFNNTFSPSAAGQTDIEDEIMQDLPGLFNWMYDGYKDLKASGHFCETEEQRVLLEEFKEQLSPLMVFAREELYTLEDVELDEPSMYFTYREWCAKNGEKALSRTKFIYEIRQVIRTDGYIIPEPHRDPDTKKWIFTFPRIRDGKKQNQTTKGDITHVPAKENAQPQKSAPVHSAQLSELSSSQAQEQEHSAHTQEQTLPVAQNQNQNQNQAPAKKQKRERKLSALERDGFDIDPKTGRQRMYFGAPEDVMDMFPVEGMTVKQCFDLGWELIHHYMRFGRKWWEHAKPEIKTFRELACIHMMMARHPETEPMLPGFSHIHSCALEYADKNDGVGTLHYTDPETGKTWTPSGCTWMQNYNA